MKEMPLHSHLELKKSCLNLVQVPVNKKQEKTLKEYVVIAFAII